MLSARVVPAPARVPALVPVLVLVLVVLAACGTESPAPTRRTDERVSAADRACRAQWTQLGTKAAEQDAAEGLVQRAFASRWDSVQAGIAYYAATADARQCGRVLTRDKAAVVTLRALVVRVLPYDMEHRWLRARTERQRYAAAHPKRHETKPVRAAYRTLRERRSAADRDIAPAVTQLAALDPDDAKAVRSGLKDLQLLATTSGPWRACKAALRTIYGYQHPPKQKKKGKKG